MDDALAEMLRAGDAAAFLDAIDEGRIEACGWAAIYVGLRYAEVMNGKWRIVDRRDSSRVNGRREEVVGYLSAVLECAGADPS